MAERTAAAEETTRWALTTQSPTAARAPEGELALRVAQTCGTIDGALAAVAADVLERKLAGLPPVDAALVDRLQRVHGEPHPWARSWLVSGPLEPALVASRLRGWLGPRAPGARRCGVALGKDESARAHLAVVTVDAFADLQPLPTRGRTGSWVTFDATLLVAASTAKLVVLGPSGMPRTVPTSLAGQRVRARFALDRPGAFRVQLVADAGSGPRPVLEAMLFADTEPPDDDAPPGAPGDTIAGTGTTTLSRMLDAVRADEGLAPFARDRRLDRLAQEHVEALRSGQRVGHDVGQGDPEERFAGAGLVAREVGENAAYEATLSLAHGRLYASPSHRANLLSPRFETIGLGIARDVRGGVWVVELFAGGLER